MDKIRVFLIVACLFALSLTGRAQKDLTALPKAERDSVLVETVQRLLRAKFPAYYRANVRPEIKEDRYSFSPDSVPEGIEPGEAYYLVTLHYDNYYEELAFEWDYTAKATVLAKNRKIAFIWLGSGFGYDWPESDKVKRQKDTYAECDSLTAAWNRRMSALPRLSSMPKAERDSTLKGIA